MMVVPFFKLFLEPRNGGQRLGGQVVEVEDDQRRLTVPVLLHPLQDVLLRLDELHLDVELARGLLDFRQEKQVVNEGKDARCGVLVLLRQRFRIRLQVLGAGAALRIVALQRRAVAVVHGMGENPARIVVLLLLAFAALVSTRTPSAGPATAAAAPSLPSVAGGMLRSNSHDALFSPAGERDRGLR